MHGIPSSDLVEKHLWIVKRFEARYQASAPHADLKAAGALGLAEAAAKFSPGKGARFATYAWNWVKGAILAELRKSFVVPVPEHQARRACKAGDSVADVVVFLGDAEDRSDHSEPRDEEPASERAADRGMRLRALHLAIEELDDPAHRHVISRTLSGRTPEQIAKGMKLGSMRVRQLLWEAQELLAEAMNDGGAIGRAGQQGG